MDQYLTDTDVRVLGALIEKQMTTPDNYPLSMNALLAACNQSSNRQPVVAYDEATALSAIQRLRRASLVRGIQRIDSRVTKYEHTAPDTLDLDINEMAVMCVLMLRGPNTVGELRTRTERLGKFESVADVETTLNALIEREQDPLVMRLARRAGQKEARFAHLLSGEVAIDGDDLVPPPNPVVNVSGVQPADDRVAVLEQRVEELRLEMNDIRRQLEEFRKQFE